MSARILVVDDNHTNLDLMVYLLKSFGHEPVGISNPLHALEAAHNTPYDLTIADVLMPGIDGFEFARRFRADPSLRDGTLIAVTALAMVGDRERLLAAGFDEYIAKPIDPQAFVSEIETFLKSTLHPSAEPPRAARAHASEAHQPTGPIILVVDDIPLNVDVIRGTLQPFGYQIVEAHNVEEAKRHLDECEAALVLCDVHMPNGDGLELIESMKATPHRRQVPFVFLSSTGWQTPERVRALTLGAKGFLLRPIDPQRLLNEVRSALEGALRGDRSDC